MQWIVKKKKFELNRENWISEGNEISQFELVTLFLWLELVTWCLNEELEKLVTYGFNGDKYLLARKTLD